MKGNIVVSKNAYPELIDYLKGKGLSVGLFGPAAGVAEPISCHPDILYCSLKKGHVYKGDERLLGPEYPEDVRYNACSTGKYFIHDLRYTDPDLLKEAEALGLIKVRVRQGYSKCSVIPVDEDSIITYDRGIGKAALDMGLNVLLIRPGYVDLPGMNTGFIGGTSGRVGDEIVFNGDLSSHPDFLAMEGFIRERGLKVKYFEGLPLTDIGSVIEL